MKQNIIHIRNVMKSVKIFFAILSLPIFFQAGYGQEFPNKIYYPQLPKSAKILNDFVPAGWEINRNIGGDLNADGVADTVLVLKGTDPKLKYEGWSTDSNPRILAVLLKDKDGFKLAAQNNSIIPIPPSPYGESIDSGTNSVSDSIKIDKGNLEFTLKFVQGHYVFYYKTEIYTFRYQDSEFVLVNLAQHNSGTDETNASESVEYKLSKFQSKYLATSQGRTKSGELSKLPSDQYESPVYFNLTKLPSFSSITSWQTAVKEIESLKDRPFKIGNNRNQIVVFDGRTRGNSFNKDLSFLNTEPDTRVWDGAAVVFREVLDNTQIRKIGLGLIKQTSKEKENYECVGMYLPLIKPVEGSFTKPGAKQTAYLYRHFRCIGDYQGEDDIFSYIGGIIIVENGKIISHNVYADIDSHFDFKDIQFLPDINQNGLTEIVLESSRKSVLIEISDKKVNLLGSVEDVNGFGRSVEKKSSVKNYKGDVISVIPGKVPVFLKDSYIKNGLEEWKSDGKSGNFSLKPVTNLYFAVYDSQTQ